jgi:hypothetical protein
MIVRALVIALALLAPAATSLAQPKEPIGFFVADVRVVSAGLPVTGGWTPAVPPSRVVPSRGLGVDLAAHAYLLRFRRAAIGVGAGWLAAGSTSSSPAPVPGATPSPIAPLPDVTTRVRALVPQVSLNFGHSLGWSYLSAGLGGTSVESEAAAISGGVPVAPRESGWVKTINYGGGARWMLNQHLGVGFDVRWYKLSIVPASDTHPGASRESLIMAGVGVVLK